jgi:ribosomal protein S27AE
MDLTPEQLARVKAKEDDVRAMFADIEWWMESKQRMIQRKSTRATRTCPKCGGKVNMVLAGRKNHLHGACETPNCIRIME